MSISRILHLSHLIAGFPKAILGPEEGEDELLGELADHGDVRVPPQDGVQLELWAECEGEAKLWMDVGEHLVLLLLRLHPDHCVPERLVGLRNWMSISKSSFSILNGKKRLLCPHVGVGGSTQIPFFLDAIASPSTYPCQSVDP